MRQIPLGKDGLLVSAIGLGCWSFAGAYGATDEAESHATLKTALDLGVDFLDTANVYGMGVSEQVIGSFIKDNPNKFKIATKAGIWRHPVTNERGFNNDPDYLRGELEKSLKRLGVEKVDLYYIHRREEARPIEEVMETLLRFKQEGKIGAIGFSEISPASLRRAQAVHPVAGVQSEYSLWTRMPELGMIQTCRELGVAFLPFSPLGRGMLTDKTPDPARFADGDFRKNNPRFMGVNFSHNLVYIEKFKKLAFEAGLAPQTLALAWLFAQGDHLIPLPGTRSSAHLRSNVAATEIILSDTILEKLNHLLPIGFAHGYRYNLDQMRGAEIYC